MGGGGVNPQTVLLREFNVGADKKKPHKHSTFTGNRGGQSLAALVTDPFCHTGGTKHPQHGMEGRGFFLYYEIHCGADCAECHLATSDVLWTLSK